MCTACHQVHVRVVDEIVDNVCNFSLVVDYIQYTGVIGHIACVISWFTAIWAITRVLGLFTSVAETVQLDMCCVVMQHSPSKGTKDILPLLNQICVFSACGCVVAHFFLLCIVL